MRNQALTQPLARLGLCVTMLALLASVGCVRMDVMPQQEPTMQSALSRPLAMNDEDIVVPLERDPTREYRVGPRDVLRIDVRQDPALSQQYEVTEEGNILLSNIGPVHVADSTTGEIQDELTEMLARYIREPEVHVGVQQYLSKVVYVVGQVQQPGPQVMRADALTLQEAIFAAGLPTDSAALSRTRIIIPDESDPLVYQVNLTDILYKGEMRHNMLLEPNTIVYVPARSSFNLSAVIRELLTPAESVASLGGQAGRLTNLDSGF